MKTLSIIIPTYNMAALLSRCLKSLMEASHAELLEAIVVNDGSKDNSLQVAREWETRYPESIVVIDKPNGNYGSTINAALPIAKGRYVKILDSDDWFDTAALDSFLSKLQHMDADMVITHFTQRWPGGTNEVVRYNTMGKEPYAYGKQYDLDEVLKDGYIRFFLMHALTYRTDLLRQIDYRQTEGISYTDTEWSCFPTFYAQTICFLDLNLYQYNLDRAGQTMAPEVIIKSLPQLDKVNDSMLQYYQQHVQDLTPIRAAWMKQYFENRLRIFYKLYLLDMPRADFSAETLLQVDEKYLPIMRELDLHPRLYPENKLLRIDYLVYWQRHHRRWPLWLEQVNHVLDVVVKWLYVKLFRN